MKTIKGPAIFLAQFAGDAPPFNSLDAIGRWAAGLGYKGRADPELGRRLFDLKNAATSKTYCDEVRARSPSTAFRSPSCRRTCRGQLVAVHPAYDAGWTALPRRGARRPGAPPAVGGRADDARCQASANLGLTAHASFSGALAWPLPLLVAAAPGRPDRDRVRRAGKRWKPILDAFDAAGVDVCYEIHPARTCTTA